MALELAKETKDLERKIQNLQSTKRSNSPKAEANKLNKESETTINETRR